MGRIVSRRQAAGVLRRWAGIVLFSERLRPSGRRHSLKGLRRPAAVRTTMARACAAFSPGVGRTRTKSHGHAKSIMVSWIDFFAIEEVAQRAAEGDHVVGAVFSWRRRSGWRSCHVSAGLLMIAFTMASCRCFWPIPAARFSRTRTTAPGRSPRARSEPGEDLLEAAAGIRGRNRRHADRPIRRLTPIKQKGGKVVHAWAFEGDCDRGAAVSNTFTMEWPPKSGDGGVP